MSCESEKVYGGDYGFIITRHVTSEKTNHYWNHCVKLLRTLYPDKLIVIIDDNSNQQLVVGFFDYTNVITIQSEYTGRGELLPYIYYAKNKWFEKAVIIHDSVFFHKRINFEGVKIPIVSLWHFTRKSCKLHLTNSLRIADSLKYSKLVKSLLSHNYSWYGCFGAQTFIKHTFLTYVMDKYNISNLVNVVKCREDRCSLERVLAVIFYLELGETTRNSMFGNITNTYHYDSYKYDEYINLFKGGKITSDVVKVFTGR
jgi:hypothetical protein